MTSYRHGLRSVALLATTGLAALTAGACGVADTAPVDRAAAAPTASPIPTSLPPSATEPANRPRSGRTTPHATRTITSRPSPSSLDAAGLAARAEVTYLVECVEDQLVQRPKTFTLTCADANQFLDRLQWADWGADTARATGVVTVNLCEPSCAQGKEASYPVRVTASGLVEGEASATYRTLTVTATGERPQGTPRVETFDLPGHQPGSGPESMVP